MGSGRTWILREAGVVQNRGLEPAVALRARRPRWAPSPQDTASPHPAARPGGGGARRGPDARRAARRDHALDRGCHGPGRIHQRLVGAADLTRARPATAPGAAVQTLHRPGLRRQIARRVPIEPVRWGPRWSGFTSITGSCRGALRRREVSDPGPRSHAGPVADEAGLADDAHPCL